MMISRGVAAGFEGLDPGGQFGHKGLDFGRYALGLAAVPAVVVGIVRRGVVAVGVSPAGFPVHLAVNADRFALGDRLEADRADALEPGDRLGLGEGCGRHGLLRGLISSSHGLAALPLFLLFPPVRQENPL